MNPALKHHDLPTLRSLLARLESATGPDREMDWLIADLAGDIPEHSIREIGFDYEWYRHPNEFCLWKAKDSEGRSVDLWQPRPVTSSLDAATALIERVLPGAEISTSTLYGVAHTSLPINGDRPGSVTRKDANVPLALLEALLTALIYIEEARND